MRLAIMIAYAVEDWEIAMPVNGRAGAVRILKLSLAEIGEAELHGKRLDASSQKRAIYPERPPVTTTGLELRSRYHSHIEGALVPKSKSKALHVIVQYPIELVDGNEPEMMLRHARAFAETVFGLEAIFSDRVDRDEKGQHVVDLFLAPRYIKRTKKTARPAVSTTKHLCELAVRHGNWDKAKKSRPPLWAQGRALQTAWWKYLSDKMGLPAERGEPKKTFGPDWRTPEALALTEAQAGVEQVIALYQAGGCTFDANRQVIGVKPGFDKRLESLPFKRDAAFALIASVDRQLTSLTKDAQRLCNDARVLEDAAAKLIEMNMKDRAEITRSEQHVATVEMRLVERETRIEALSVQIQSAHAEAEEQKLAAASSLKLAQDLEAKAKYENDLALRRFGEEIAKANKEAAKIKEKAEAEVRLIHCEALDLKVEAAREADEIRRKAGELREAAERDALAIRTAAQEAHARAATEIQFVRAERKSLGIKRDDINAREQYLNEREEELSADRRNIDSNIKTNNAIRIGISSFRNGDLIIINKNELKFDSEISYDRQKCIYDIIRPVLDIVTGAIIAYDDSVRQEAMRLVSPLSATFASMTPDLRAAVLAKDAEAEKMLQEPDNSDWIKQYLEKKRNVGRGR